MENYAIINKLTNLISIVNPGLKGKSGIEAALLYRIIPCCKEIDSSDLVKEAYKQYYGISIPDCSDTIFNAFIPFKDFCVAKLCILAKNNNCYYPFTNGYYSKYRKDLNELIYLYLDDIFNGYEDLRKLFDRYFDLMYSFSNFMPVPHGFNGSEKIIGKGNWKLNKDYPLLYKENLQDKNSKIYKKEEMKKWLNENMEKYKIKDMYNLEPPYPINEYYGYNDVKLQPLKNFIKKAIRLIEDRFEI